MSKSTHFYMSTFAHSVKGLRFFTSFGMAFFSACDMGSIEGDYCTRA